MVKFRLKHLKLAFIIAGTVIGSGFITGRELIRFFGSSNFIPAVYVACLLLFFFSYILMDVGRRLGNLEQVNKLVFKKYAKIVEFFTYVSLAIIASGMLAGLDLLFNQTFQLPSYFVVCSVGGIVAAKAISGKGLDGLAKMSVILVPLMVVFVLYFLLARKNFSYTYSESYSGFEAFVMAAFYPSMNMFLAAPVLINAGSRFKYGLKTSAATAALCLFLCIILILSAINYEGANALQAEMPLLYISGSKGILAKIFMVIVFLAMFSSLVSSYYPLSDAISKKPKSKLYGIVLIAVMLLLSRMGLSGIVRYFYPALGAFGLLYISAVTLYSFADRGLILPLYGKLLNKGDCEIHNRGKKT